MNLKLPVIIQPPPQSDPESGFTLIESLLAIVVVAILLVGVGPIVGFSAATRVQARRVEIGLQMSRSYLSGVTASTIDDPPINQTNNGGEPVALQLDDVPVPDSAVTLNCNANDYCTAPIDNTSWALYCIDQDNDGFCTSGSAKDLVIQAFGLQAGDDSDPENFISLEESDAAVRPDLGYQLGIRVYRANAFGQNPIVTLQSNGGDNEAKIQASTVTSGMGSRALPIAEMSTEVNTAQTDYTDYCQRINTGVNQGQCNL
ncbi:MAG: hormogonium polysaccharide secretion pseudopilin HpsB [Cyanobacteria bacterium P01_G01_bin.54]